MRRLISLLLVTAAAVAFTPPAGAAQEVTITLVTHDSFNVSKSVLRAFTKRTEVKVLRSGDAGQALNQVILTKDDPIGDVFYGIDNTFLSRGLDAGIFEPYTAKGLDRVPREYVLDDEHRVTPIDRADVCVNDDKRWFADHDLPRPTTLKDLADPRFRGLLVVENPATSSTGLSFLAATVAALGPGGWEEFWRELRQNDVKVVDGWEQAWYDNFSAAGKGDRPLVVSYASSPPATVNKAGTKARAGTLVATCFQQIEFAGVLNGTKHERAARKLVDFMLSAPFQADMPEQMYVFPAREGVPVPSAFRKFAPLPDPEALEISPQDFERNREQWIRLWTQIVLR
jgi:thiamine transport system substrate-binding protein